MIKEKVFKIAKLSFTTSLTFFILYRCYSLNASVKAENITPPFPLLQIKQEHFQQILAILLMIFDKITSMPLTMTISLFFLSVILFILYVERKKKQELQKIAYTDPLTGGSNYLKFEHDAKQLFFKFGIQKYAVLYMDIDKFKYINEIYDYATGNKTLIHIHNILNRNIHGNELSARINSDCFALLIECKSPQTLANRVQKIFDDISELEHIGLDHYELIVSCGIYVSDSTKLDITTMVDLANIARVTIKGGHKSSFEFYTDDLHEQIINEKILENHMTSAISNKEFLVYMQPKFKLNNNKIVSAEALVRWQSPIRGLLPPCDFIPFFEKNGFIVTLDLYVFETVCHQIRWWFDNNYIPLPVSLNISRVSLRQNDFINNLQEILKKYNIPSCMIELELTESALFENQRHLFSIVNALKKIGFIFTIDDFGSGYSSLYMLKEIPVDILKIDRSFLTGNFNNYRNKIIMKKIIEMAKLLNITVVSEGVETVEQAEILLEIGCDIVQGYLFSLPITIDEYNKLLFKQESEIIEKVII